MRESSRVLALQIAEMRHAFYNRGRVRGACKRDERSIVSAADLAFQWPDVGMPCMPVCEDDEGAVQRAINTIIKSTSKRMDVRTTSSGKK